MRIASLSSSILEQNGLALYALESMFGSAGALGFGGPCGQWKQQGEHSKEEDAGPCNEEPCDTDGRSVAGKCARGKSRDTGHQEKRQQILNRGFFAACGFPAEETLRRFERTLMLTATTAATALALGIALPKILHNRDGGWNVQAATAVAVLLLPMFVAMRCTYAAAQ